jgi:hypothetical protein
MEIYQTALSRLRMAAKKSSSGKTKTRILDLMKPGHVHFLSANRFILPSVLPRFTAMSPMESPF